MDELNDFLSNMSLEEVHKDNIDDIENMLDSLSLKDKVNNDLKDTCKENKFIQPDEPSTTLVKRRETSCNSKMLGLANIVYNFLNSHEINYKVIFRNKTLIFNITNNNHLIDVLFNFNNSKFYYTIKNKNKRRMDYYDDDCIKRPRCALEYKIIGKHLEPPLKYIM